MTEYHIHRVGAILIKNHKVLMARDKAEDYFKSPGGKLESQETSRAAIIRELKEELKIDANEEDLELFGTFFVQVRDDKAKTVRMDTLLVNKWSGDFVPSDDVEELKWVDSSDLGKIKLGHVFQDHVIPALKTKGLIG